MRLLKPTIPTNVPMRQRESHHLIIMFIIRLRIGSATSPSIGLRVRLGFCGDYVRYFCHDRIQGKVEAARG